METQKQDPKKILIEKNTVRLLVDHTWKVSNRYGYNEGMVYFLMWMVLVFLGSGFIPFWLALTIFVGSVIGGRIWAIRVGDKKREEIYKIVGVEDGNE